MTSKGGKEQQVVAFITRALPLHYFGWPSHAQDADPRTVLRAVDDNGVSILRACELTLWWHIDYFDKLMVTDINHCDFENVFKRKSYPGGTV